MSVHNATRLHLKESCVFEAAEKLKSIKVCGGGGTGGGNAYYGGVSKTGMDYYTYPCHMYMKHVHMGAEVIYSKFARPDAAKYQKATDAWFDWITGPKSPWAPVFKLGMTFAEKKFFGPEFWRTHGFIFDRLDKIPSNVLHNFLVASRMPHEWPGMVLAWYEMVQKGVSPEMALALESVWVIGCSENTQTKDFQMQPTNFYDWPLDVGTANEKYVQNFLLHDMQKDVFNKPYSESHQYTPVNAIWGRSSTGKKYQTILKETYEKTFGKQAEAKATWGTPIGGTSWRVTPDEIAEIGIKEDKRLR